MTMASEEERGTEPEEHGKEVVAASVNSDEDFYIQCDAPNCNEWYEGSTLSPPVTPVLASTYETWHCPSCIPYHGPSKEKNRALREGLRKKRRIDFVKLNDPAALLESESSSNNIGLAANDVQEIDFRAKLQLRQKKGMFKKGASCCLKVSKGQEFDMNYVDKHGFNQPVLYESQSPSQIGLKVPGKDGAVPFSFGTVAKLVGPYRAVQVIDTATQLTTEYTLQEWVDYLTTPEKERTRILNVITLEYSQTPLGNMVTEPKFARDVDFVSKCWPKTVDELQRILDHRGENNPAAAVVHSDDGRDMDDNIMNNSSEEEDLAELLNVLQEEIPRVSKYCLMTACNAYTDFHVDFGGTAVWYHVYFGQKIFYFIEPTQKHLKIFSDWATNGSSGSKKSNANAFLPDLITAAGGDVFEVRLKKGQTLFIPSGWIHAVFTPKDSLVFGGNFVHRHSLEMQLTIYRLEKRMRVGKEYKFPNYQKLMWFVAWNFLKQKDNPMTQLKNNDDENVMGGEQQMIQQLCEKYPNHVLFGYKALAKELETWAKSKQKMTIEQFPENMDVAKVAMQFGELLAKCISHIGGKKNEKQKIKPEKGQNVKKEKKRKHAQTTQVISPIKHSSSPPASKKCKVEVCLQYKRSKCDGFCGTHYREQLSLRGDGDYQAVPAPGRGCKAVGCIKYKKTRCEGYCMVCFRESLKKPRPSPKEAHKID